MEDGTPKAPAALAEAKAPTVRAQWVCCCEAARMGGSVTHDTPAPPPPGVPARVRPGVYQYGTSQNFQGKNQFYRNW